MFCYVDLLWEQLFLMKCFSICHIVDLLLSDVIIANVCVCVRAGWSEASGSSFC